MTVPFCWVLGSGAPKAMAALGLGFEPSDVLACIVHGALYYVPILIVTFAVGGGVDAACEARNDGDAGPCQVAGQRFAITCLGGEKYLEDW